MLKITKMKLIFFLFLLFIFTIVAAKDKEILFKAEKAIARAKNENKYLAVYFYGEDKNYKKINKIIKKAEKRWPKTVNFITIKVTDPQEKEIVKKCSVTRVPFTAVIAPNEAITARFPGIAELEILQKGFVSPKTAELLRGVQAENIIFLCLVNNNTKYRKDVLVSVREAVNKLSGIAEFIEIDPKDRREISLLNRIEISSDIKIAVTLVIAPTGIIMEKFTGKITPRDLYDSFQKILAMDKGCGAPTATGSSACDPGSGIVGSKGCK